jgi:hypothetical protein
VKIPLILRKIFENTAGESGSSQLKVGKFTCMHYAHNGLPLVFQLQYSSSVQKIQSKQENA